jgi:hypothetical protein
MKVQEVILKAMAGSLQWWEAAEIIGVSDRTMRRWRARYEKHGYNGYDYRKQRPSAKRIPMETAEKVLQLYRERYFDFNVRKRSPAPARPRRRATAAGAPVLLLRRGHRCRQRRTRCVPPPEAARLTAAPSADAAGRIGRRCYVAPRAAAPLRRREHPMLLPP